jgi:hypothetical protein
MVQQCTRRPNESYTCAQVATPKGVVEPTEPAGDLHAIVGRFQAARRLRFPGGLCRSIDRLQVDAKVLLVSQVEQSSLSKLLQS